MPFIDFVVTGHWLKNEADDLNRVPPFSYDIKQRTR